MRQHVRRFPVVEAVKRRILGHDGVYDAAYYADVDVSTSASSPTMAATIVRELHPRAVLDIGCGTGAFLAAIREHGVSVFGLEYSRAGIEYARRRGLDVRRYDLTRDEPPVFPVVDVVTSMEVAEHLPASFADHYVSRVAGYVPPGGWLIFTAATPGQGGTDHLNEQPHSYWISKFVSRGLRFDEQRSHAWRMEWDGQTAFWYSNNVMVFRRPPYGPAVPIPEETS